MGSLPPSSLPLARKRCPEFGFSGLSTSLIDLPVTHEDPHCHGYNDADFGVNAPLPCPVRLMCAPSLDPPQLCRRQSFVIRKSRTAIVPAAVILSHFFDADNAFPEEKEDPRIHHGQAAQRPQYGCIIPMLLLTWNLVTAFPRFSASTKPAQIVMIMNGRGLSPPPPFGLRRLYAHTSYHLTWHAAPLIPCSHKLAAMSSLAAPFAVLPMDTFTIHGGPSRIRLCRTVHDGLQRSPIRRRLDLSAIFATDDLREQKRLDRHVRHFDHDFWQQECEHLVFRGNLAKFL